MSQELCCTGGNKNFGRPACIEDMGVIDGAILVPLISSTGIKNRIALSSFTYNDVLSKFIDYAEPRDRWYDLPQFVVVEPTVGDTQFQEAPSGKKVKTRTGIRSFAAQIWAKDATPAMSGKLESVSCGSWAMFLKTSENNIVGIVRDGYLYPIPIDEQSFDPKYMFPTDTTSAMINLGFDFSRMFKIAEMYLINMNRIWDDSADGEYKTIELSDLPKVVDCNLVVSGTPTTTTVTVIVNDDYRQGTRIGDVDPKGNIKGLLLADFLVYNATDALTVTATSVTESEAGVYDIVMPAQGSGDNIEVSLTMAPINNIEYLNYSGKVSYLIP